MNAAITTVTRRVFKTAFNGTFVDADHASTTRTMVIVADMQIGEAFDRGTFDAHLALGSEGAAMKEGVLVRHFEREDVLGLLIDLLAGDCTLHPVLGVNVLWDARRHSGFVNPLAMWGGDARL
jgi:hypothetical protein